MGRRLHARTTWAWPPCRDHLDTGVAAHARWRIGHLSPGSADYYRPPMEWRVWRTEVRHRHRHGELGSLLAVRGGGALRRGTSFVFQAHPIHTLRRPVLWHLGRAR